MTVGFFCNRTVVICRESDSVLEAARRMREFDVGSVVVVEEKKDGVRAPVGILTDRDIVVRMAGSDHFEAASERVGDVMSRGLALAREEEDLEDALTRMRAHGVRRMPVVNNRGGLEGIIAFDDLLELFSDALGDLSRLISKERQREGQRTHTQPL